MSEKVIKILVVEDDDIAQRVSQAVLEKLNCQIEIAKNAVEALKNIDKNRYNLVFMDLGLPRLDGFILTDTIRKLKGKSGRMPIIALTAHIEEIYKRKGCAVGITDFLEKPLTEKRMRAVLDQYVL